MKEKPIIRRLSEQPEEASSCGIRRKLIDEDDNFESSITHLKIKDMHAHYHFETTEFYYILQGKGRMRLDADEFAVEPGMVIAIPPGVVHEVIGDVEAIIIATPPFRSQDQYFGNKKSA